MDDVLIVRENEYCQSEKVTIFIGVIYAYKGLLLVSSTSKWMEWKKKKKGCNLTLERDVEKAHRHPAFDNCQVSLPKSHRTFTFQFLFPLESFSKLTNQLNGDMTTHLLYRPPNRTTHPPTNKPISTFPFFVSTFSFPFAFPRPFSRPHHTTPSSVRHVVPQNPLRFPGDHVQHCNKQQHKL